MYYIVHIKIHSYLKNMFFLILSLIHLFSKHLLSTTMCCSSVPSAWDAQVNEICHVFEVFKFGPLRRRYAPKTIPPKNY